MPSATSMYATCARQSQKEAELMASNLKVLQNASPALVIPDHFFCNQSSKLVVVYDDPIGEEDDPITLNFPGDLSGSSPQRITPQRVGKRTLIFNTPVYSSCRGLVEVVPLLTLPSGEVTHLAHFKLTLKHPIRSVMELCLSLSTHNAILPVILSLMVHCQNDNSKEHFQDPHIDRVMATLVGSRAPGDSTCIQDIILPSRKWRRMNLTEFANHFNLSEMEKQAYILNKQRSKWVKSKSSPKRTKTMLRGKTTDEGEELDDEEGPVEDRLHQHFSSSTPDIHTLDLQGRGGDRDSGVSEESDAVQKMIRGAKSVCRVMVDFIPEQNDPSCIPLKVNQRVYVVQESTADWWYGVCEGRRGYFPPSHVKAIREGGKIRSTTIVEPLHGRSRANAHSEALASLNNAMNYSLLSPSKGLMRTESERSDSSQPDSPLLERHNRLKTNPGHMFTGSPIRMGEGKGHSSGFQSDSGISEESPSNTIQKSAQPSTKQQLLHCKHPPILPPSKSSIPGRFTHSHPSSTSPLRGDSEGDESTNVDSSDSDSYEDVMSGEEEEEETVKSSWTTKPIKPITKSFVPPPMRNKILPSVPDTPPLTSWKTSSTGRHNSERNNYDDVVFSDTNYENIVLDAFEIVDDHIYDRVELPTERNAASAIYQMTATDAHVKVATQMAQNTKQASQVDRSPQWSQDDLSERKSFRWHHDRPPIALPEPMQSRETEMSPRTLAFIPPRDIPRSPVHNSSAGGGGQDSPSIQPKWGKAPISPPHSKLSKVAPKMHESPILPTKAFSHPSSPPVDSTRFDPPALPPKMLDEPIPSLPPKVPTRTVTLSSKPLPMLPPKQPPAPPPKTSTLSSAEAPSVPPKTSSLTHSEIPELPPKVSHFVPVDIPVVRPKFSKSPSLPPAAEPPVVPPKSSNQSTMPAVLPKSGKRPVAAPAPVPPAKQPPDVPRKTFSTHTERSPPRGGHSWNGGSRDGQSGDRESETGPGVMPKPAMNLAMILANAQQHRRFKE